MLTRHPVALDELFAQLSTKSCSLSTCSSTTSSFSAVPPCTTSAVHPGCTSSWSCTQELLGHNKSAHIFGRRTSAVSASSFSELGFLGTPTAVEGRGRTLKSHATAHESCSMGLRSAGGDDQQRAEALCFRTARTIDQRPPPLQNGRRTSFHDRAKRLRTAFPAAIEPPLTKGLGCASGVLRAKFDPATGEFRGIIQQPGKLTAKLNNGAFDRAMFEDQSEDEKPGEDDAAPETPPAPQLPAPPPTPHGVEFNFGLT
ncbi:unnamed protein product [Amoebophrya sp. A120]|nr:unnamed protein product [Amoebophrya sp. A120]|eukprot:GSA120T00000298001.1